MQRSPLKLIVSLFFAALIIFLAGRYTPLGRIHLFPRAAANVLASLFSKFEAVNKFGSELARWRTLADENEQLKKENGELFSRLARLDVFERENDFLRKALDLEQEIGRDVAYGHVFNLNLGPDGYNVLLNKGSSDGISKDDLVITEEKALVGVIEDVSENVSRVLFVFDPEFKITARVLGADTAGIARGAHGEGMYFDLIAKEDEIKEGDFLISTGDDMFPAGLAVGRIAHVEINESQMFKKVRIVPSAGDQRLGSVVILKRNR
jgi:rod shape-determining protein MreC